jgi:hypothetical protein
VLLLAITTFFAFTVALCWSVELTTQVDGTDNGPTFRFFRLQVLQATGMMALWRNSIDSDCSSTPLRSVGVGFGSSSGSLGGEDPDSMNEL